MDHPTPYNPLAKTNLAASIVSKLLRQKPENLPPGKFIGAGIYLIYYTGNFEPYRPVSNANWKDAFAQPIYVGKAVPSGGRKGAKGLDTPHGDALHNRLDEHADSILAVPSLSITDFKCRWLVVDEVFIHLGETMLITHFKPLWNLVVDGFGNHAPGKGRKKGKKPMWDVIHPGRPWAKGLNAAVSSEQVLKLVQHHFAVAPVPPPDVVE